MPNMGVVQGLGVLKTNKVWKRSNDAVTPVQAPNGLTGLLDTVEEVKYSV